MVELVNAKSVKGRYVIAKFGQWFPMWLKPLLPPSIFESFLRSFYHL